ncbi:uncharacterized protein LOC113467833 [Diaphorina citri]|uniref:Uncharacterized protein LOC113467833 n=1 Tax=Diaphorina citri TaxID=121845 RepID=A0A3Q0IUW3_DIACI|nr:uncharacterized protein LOC113467833 [Diaphorina citri]
MHTESSHTYNWHQQQIQEWFSGHLTSWTYFKSAAPIIFRLELWMGKKLTCYLVIKLIKHINLIIIDLDTALPNLDDMISDMSVSVNSKTTAIHHRGDRWNFGGTLIKI